VKLTKTLASAALELAQELGAKAILVSTQTGRTYHMLKHMTHGPRVIAATVNRSTFERLRAEGAQVILMPSGTRIPQLQHAIGRACVEGLVQRGDVLVCLIGERPGAEADTLFVHQVNGLEGQPLAGLDRVAENVIELSIKMAREGMDGKPVGTSFTIGDAGKVMRLSAQIGINPFKSYRISVLDRKSWYLIRRYALACEGTFVVRSNGLIVGADRYLKADHVRVSLPSGLGTRHRAIARITKVTRAVGVVVSESDRQVRVFREGKLIATIDPLGKLWAEVA